MTHEPPFDPVAETLSYYDRHADAFVERTARRNMEHLYARFLALLPDGARVLDAGCGSGRDAAAFAARGYAVTAFDGSAELAKRASERAGIAVRTMRFDDVEWQEEFDGVWACASLLHLPPDALGPALRRLVRALRPGGVLFVSMKAGDFQGKREERWFTDITPDGLRTLLTDSGLEVSDIWEADEERPGGIVRWVNGLARRGAGG